MPQDEFEELLKRCQDSLAAIELSVPGINGPSQPPVKFSLTQEEPATPAPPYSLDAPPPVAEPAPKPAAAYSLDASLPPPEPEPAFPEVAPEAPARSAPDLNLTSLAPAVPTRAPLAVAALPSSRAGMATARLWAAGALVAAVCAAGLWYASRAGDTSVELERSDAAALRPERGDMIAARGGELVGASLSGAVLRRAPLKDTVAGMHWDAGVLWTIDGRTPTVIARTDNPAPDVVYRLNHVPGAIFVKDQYLWTSERGSQSIRQFLISRSILGAMLQPLDRFELPGLRPAAFSLDSDSNLWLVDSGTRRLHHLRFDGSALKPVESAPLAPLIGAEGDVKALAISGGAVWLLYQAGGRDILRRAPLRRLDWAAP